MTARSWNGQKPSRFRETASTYLIWFDGSIDSQRMRHELSKPSRHLPTHRPWMLLLDLRPALTFEPDSAAVLRDWVLDQPPRTLVAVAAVAKELAIQEVLPSDLSRPPVEVFSTVAAAQAWLSRVARQRI